MALRGIAPTGALWSRVWISAGLRVDPGYQIMSRPAVFQQTRCFVQMRTKLNVADNSGAKIVGCIQAKARKIGGSIGDVIVASVKEAASGKKRIKKFEKESTKVKKGDVVRAVIINKEGEPVGTRVYGPVAAELRAKKFVKILSLADDVV
ncbi:uncharacterized protein LOC9660506 isoform X2 [Selaginella moellendorffii]|uniref:uncharacterized protein LOC9660506 isoform X2 n=1 Tax=Selaginella moellendorffii TaxID=88036 RepID=UPI000D1C3B18|nr:uncharacterized protein LOC9660506 isoform X2 [Selaginella moellendorffii]|eukprot:XP_024525213.1 uncharacterized protein LOC9660506 isoform X2 [Selaginella moellendorffii]